MDKIEKFIKNIIKQVEDNGIWINGNEEWGENLDEWIFL